MISYKLVVLPTEFLMETKGEGGASFADVTKTRPTQRQVRAFIKQGKKSIHDFFNGARNYD